MYSNNLQIYLIPLLFIINLFIVLGTGIPHNSLVHVLQAHIYTMYKHV